MKFSAKSYQNFYFRTSVKKTEQVIQESQNNKMFEKSDILSSPAYSLCKSLAEMRSQLNEGLKIENVPFSTVCPSTK